MSITIPSMPASLAVRRSIAVISLVLLVTLRANAVGQEKAGGAHRGQQQTEPMGIERKLTLSFAAEARIRSLPPERQATEVRKLSRGVYVNLPAFWNAVQEPTVLLDALGYYPEPLSPDCLAAIKRLLPKAQNPAQGIRLAALLYRYHIDAGRSYLLKAANERDGDQAATVLAMNRDAGVLEAVGRIMAQLGLHGNLCGSLAEWQHPAIAPMLLQAYRREPNNIFLITPLAVHQVKAAVPLLERAMSHPSSTLEKILLAAAIVKLNGPTSRTAMDFLNDAAGKPGLEGDEMREGIVTALANVKVPQVIPLASQGIENYLNRTRDAGHLSEGDVMARSFAIASATGLCRMRSKPSAGLILRLLRDMSQEPQMRQSQDTSDVAVAALTLGVDPAQVESVMGHDWMAKRLKDSQLSKLRTIPNFYLPGVIYVN